MSVTYPSQVEADAAGVDGSATHDTINSLLSDAGSGRGRIELLNRDGLGKPGHQYSQDTHYQKFCANVLKFCHKHEAITMPSPLPGRAALRVFGVSVAATPGRDCPESAASSSSTSSNSSSSCWLATMRAHHRRFERYAGKTHDSCIFSDRYLRSCAGSAVVARCPGLLRRVLRRRARGPRGVRKLSRHTPQTRFFTLTLHVTRTKCCESIFLRLPEATGKRYYHLSWKKFSSRDIWNKEKTRTTKPRQHGLCQSG